MNLDIQVNKNACFYYWILILSGWDADYIDNHTYRHYATDRVLSEHLAELADIKGILQRSENPRGVLAELYSSKISSDEAKTIAKISKALETTFEDVWKECSPHLRKWQDTLRLTDFSNINVRMQEIANFLNSDSKLNSPYVLYLIQNTPGYTPGGLTINNTDFMLVMPADIKQKNSINNLISVITHEYIHYIERGSRNSRELFKKSYDKHIKTNNLPAPNRFKWKMMYVEVIVYCFSSKRIGGYLRPEIYHAPRPTVSIMKNSFDERFKAGNFQTEEVINWAALNILPDVEEYIKCGRTIDQHIADKIGKILSEFYLTEIK